MRRSELADRHPEPQVKVGDGLVVHAISDPDALAGLPRSYGWVADDEPRRLELVQAGLDRRGSQFKGIADGADGDVGVRTQVAEDRCFDEVSEERDGVVGVFGARRLRESRHVANTVARPRASPANHA